MADTYQEHQECLEFEAREQSDFWFACIDNAVIFDPNLSMLDFRVFCILRAFVNVRTNEWVLRVKTLADKAGVSERSVQRSLKVLVERGLIEREERFCKGKQSASLYRIIGHRAACYQNDEIAKGDTPDTSANFRGDSGVACMGDCGVAPSLREPKTYEKKDTPTGAAPAEATPKDPDQETDSGLLSVSEAPSAMRSTAEYLLLKTGRKGLDEEEISALRTLDAHQYPARVQREIDKAVERYGRLGRPLRTLSFGYILSSLQHQPSRAPGGGKPPGRKTPKVDYGLDV